MSTLDAVDSKYFGLPSYQNRKFDTYQIGTVSKPSSTDSVVVAVHISCSVHEDESADRLNWKAAARDIDKQTHYPTTRFLNTNILKVQCSEIEETSYHTDESRPNPRASWLSKE